MCFYFFSYLSPMFLLPSLHLYQPISTQTNASVLVSFAVQKNGTNLTYYVRVSTGQKSRPSSAESSAEEDLPKLESRCWLGCILIQRLDWGRISF